MKAQELGSEDLPRRGEPDAVSTLGGAGRASRASASVKPRASTVGGGRRSPSSSSPSDSSVPRRNSAPNEEALSLVRDRYRRFLAAQVLASNLVPLAYFAQRCAAVAWRSPPLAAALPAAALTCLIASCALALCFLYARAQDAARDALLTALVRLEHAQMSVLSLALLFDAVTRPGSCPGGASAAAACAASYFSSAHCTLALKWVVTQVPVRVMLLPEAARNAAVAAATLALAHARQPEGVTVPLLIFVLARGLAVTLTAPLLCAVCHSRTFTTAHLPAELSRHDGHITGRVAAFWARVCVRAANAILPEYVMSATAVTGVSMGVFFSLAVNGGLGGDFRDVCRRVNAVSAFSLLVAGAAKMQAGTSTDMVMLERRLGRSSVSGSAALLELGLDARLADAGSEAEVLRCASEAAHSLFPQARAQALVSLVDARSLRAAHVEAAALEERERTALHAALTEPDARGSSAAFVCSPGGAPIADSRDFSAGADSFSDWRAAREAGLGAHQLVTARFSTGSSPSGYLVLAFGGEHGFPSNEPAALDALRALCDVTGAALLRRRAADAASSAAARLAHVERLAADIFPAHLLEQVATRMSADEPGPLVEHHTCVSVVFADVVGWTHRAAGLTPEQAMRLLDSLWQRFDSLCTAHGVYKVETIGDSYLAVCGMHPPRRDHAQAALRFALDLHTAAAGTTLEGNDVFSIRVGVHSGPLTSGVIGHMRQRWCIFGDTVNTASRMESSGRPGSVQMSSATLALCGLDPAVVPSRVVDIRGKGEMHTFVLDAGSQEALATRAMLDVEPASASSDEERMTEQQSERTSTFDAGGEDAVSDSEGPPLRSFAPAGAAANAAEALSGPGSVSSGAGKAAGDATEVDASVSKRAHAHAVSALLLGTCGPLGFCTFWSIFMSGGNPAIVAAGWLLGCSFLAALPLLAAGHYELLPASMQLSRPLVLRLCLVACLGCDLVGHGLAQRAWCESVAPGMGCSIAFFFDFHAVMGATAPLTSMLPVHLALAPEFVRFSIFVGTALTWYRAQLTAAMLARLLLYGVASLVLTPLVLVCAVDVPAGVHDALTAVETCPAWLQPTRDRVASYYARLRTRLLGEHEPPLLERTGLAVFGLRVVKVIHQLITADSAEISSGRALCAGCRDLNATLILVIAASALSRVSLRTAGSSAEAMAAAQKLRVAAILRDLQEHLAGARSEAASLAAGCAALGALFPSASAVAVGAFAQGASFGVLSGVELSAADERARASLAAALPPDVGGTSGTSVHRACRVAARGAASAVLDSRDCEGGVAECADWAAALEGVAASRALTLPLTAGPMVVGFATVYLSLFHADDNGASMHAVLREAAGVIGGALFVRRAFAINRDGEVRPTRETHTPQRRISSAAAAAAEGSDAEGHYPANDADDAALALLDARSAADCATLDSWALDAQSLADEDKHRLLAAMLHSLGLFRRFRLSPTAFADFVADTATHYSDNPFHNFAHAFKVAHQCWLFARDEAMRGLMEDVDLLALLLAAICHDLEHPGTTNSFQVNTCSVLALRYNDASVLESHHAAVGFTTIQRSRLLAGMEAEELRVLRRTFVASVLATDMANHKQLLARVAAAVATGGGDDDAAESTPAPSGRRTSLTRSVQPGGGFARRQPEDRQLLVAFLLHCADLGNPLCPWSLSERNAEELQREFEAQAVRERAAGLPVTVMLAASAEAKAKLELGFLDFVVTPLFVTLASIVPRLGNRCLKLIALNKAAWTERLGE